MAPKLKQKQNPNPKPIATQQSEIERDIQSEGQPLEELFASLEEHISARDHNRIIKVADEIIAGADPSDPDAVECKLVALIQSDRIDDALAFIHSSSHLPIDLRFHKAYCLYRCNRLDEALEVLQGLERNSNILQLEAQILYRQGAMTACINSYENLIQKIKIDSIELKTNIIAAFVSGGRSAEVSSLMGTMKVASNSSFELAYNAACALIEKGNFAEAQELLLLARRIGQEMLIEEEYSEEEIENELAPISVQLAYVKQVLEPSDDAMTTYNNILKQKLGDASSVAVATNNLVALKGPTKDVFDSLKKLEKLIEKNSEGHGLQLADGLEHKLSSRQKEAIYCNRTLLLLHANKLDQGRETISSLLNMFPDSLMPTLLQTSLLIRENKSSKAEEILGHFAKKHPKNSTLALLARAQVAAAAGHYLVALDSLGQIPDIQHRPGTVATMVALKEKASDVDGAEAIFDGAIEWWSNNMREDRYTLELIMHEAASFKLKHKKVKAASDLFEQLVKSSSPVIRANALNGLVSATAFADLAKAEVYEKQLPPLPDLSSVDLIALEKTPGADTNSIGKHIRAADAVKMLGEGDDKSKAKLKKKRKRKPRYPKGFDPANPGPPPDPERWLPKRERSSYRPKRKDRRAAQVRGSQGAVARDKPGDYSTNGPSSSKSSQALSNAGKATNSKGSSEVTKPSTSSSQRSKKKSRK